MNNFEILKLLNETEANAVKEINCKKRTVVAILYRDNTPVMVGYNSVVLPTAPGVCRKCVEGKYKVEKGTCPLQVRPTCPAIHAEIDCLAKWANWDAHCTYSLAISYSPCPECCKLIRTLPISKVYVKTPRLKELSEADKMTYNVDNYDELAKLLLTTNSNCEYEVL